MENRIKILTEYLDLKPHPEGGFFSETYRSKESYAGESLPERYNSDRCFFTSIYFLITGESFSAFHKLQTDEIWHFYEGSPVELYVITESRELMKIVLGDKPEYGMRYTYLVDKNCWLAAKLESGNYALTGCTVAPGFEFADLEMGDRKKLIKDFPEHKEIIERLTR